MQNAIEMTQVSKRYPHFQLSDVDLTLPQGEIMGLVGVNGAGKSTTLRILMGLVQADSGQVRVLGQLLPDKQVEAKWDIGYASDDMRLYKSKSLQWHMDFIRSIYPTWDDDYAQNLLKRFDLTTEQKIAGFSHGQRVKALLLLVLSRRPQVLVLDEPTTGLDPVARREVLEALAEILKDEHRSVLFSSHNTLDIEQLSDSIMFLHQGKVVASKDKESFVDEWRRVLCQGAWSDDIRHFPGVAAAKQNGSIIELKIRDYSAEVINQLRQSSLRIDTVEPMSLEDIFIESIKLGDRT